jgi:hypothetical protein
MWDQSNFGDAMLSAVLGRPVFQVRAHAMNLCTVSFIQIIEPACIVDRALGYSMVRKLLTIRHGPIFMLKCSLGEMKAGPGRHLLDSKKCAGALVYQREREIYKNWKPSIVS